MQCGIRNGRTIIVGRVGGRSGHICPVSQPSCSFQVVACFASAALSRVQGCTAPVTHLSKTRVRDGWVGRHVVQELCSMTLPAAAAFDGALCLASCHGEEVSSAAAAHDCALGLVELHFV